MSQGGTVARSLKSAEDMDKLGDMVEDIRDAMMEYQVCLVLRVLAIPRITFALDVIATRPIRNELQGHCELPSFAPFNPVW